MKHGLRTPLILALALALAASFALAGGLQVRDPLEIVFLDVGQADAVLVRDPGGQVALIDAGRASLLDELRSMGVDRIDLLVATHPHADHIGGMQEIVETLPVRFYMDNGDPHTTATYARLMGALQGRPELTYLEATPRVLTLGETRIEVLPLPERAEDNLNDRSVALRIHYGSFVAWLSGDSEEPALDHFVSGGAVEDVVLLKAAHHGSNNGFTGRFLDVARPEIVVVSVGQNSYGHPGARAMDAYGRVADTVYRTDRDGRVTVRGYEDGTFEVQVEHE